MIDWNKATRDELITIKAIALRSKNSGNTRDFMDIQMDIQAVHTVCKLDLRKLLTADDFNFDHDIYGIERHLNRSTGELENFFVPRCVLNREEGEPQCQ